VQLFSQIEMWGKVPSGAVLMLKSGNKTKHAIQVSWETNMSPQQNPLLNKWKGQHVLAKHNYSWRTLIILRNEIDVHNVFCIIILLQKEIRETYFLKAGFTPKIHNMKYGMLHNMNMTTCISELLFYSH
jgi:hypothetical protein